MNAQDVGPKLERVRERIAAACMRAGRDPDEVRLVAVSKRIELPLLVEACRLGQWTLGENRVQDALSRQDELAKALAAAQLPADRAEWHFIGHLQGNKASRTVGRFSLNHGVDSMKLAERLSRLASEAGVTERILLEVNISQEEQKHGFAVGETAGIAARIAEMPGLQLRGLMGMARAGADEAGLRAAFALLRRTRDAAADACGTTLPELSMGMSGDFEEAIAEGATLVRVGSAVFGSRQY